jgi:hypothetical protein
MLAATLRRSRSKQAEWHVAPTCRRYFRQPGPGRHLGTCVPPGASAPWVTPRECPAGALAARRATLGGASRRTRVAGERAGRRAACGGGRARRARTGHRRACAGRRRHQPTRRRRHQPRCAEAGCARILKPRPLKARRDQAGGPFRRRGLGPSAGLRANTCSNSRKILARESLLCSNDLHASPTSAPGSDLPLRIPSARPPGGRGRSVGGGARHGLSAHVRAGHRKSRTVGVRK